MPKLSAFQLVLLGIFAALAISGVLIFALVINGNTSASLGAVRIWGTLDQTAFNEVLEQVSDLDKTYEQVTYVQKNASTFMEDLTEALATGSAPDLFILSQDYAIQDSRKISPTTYEQLTETQFRNTFIEAADPFLLRTGIMAMPLVADPLVLYWNRDLFSTAGYATPPRFWDEISGISQKITKKNDEGQITKSTVSFGEYRNVTHAKDIMSLLILQAGNPIVIRTDEGGYNTVLSEQSGGARQAAESAIRFYAEFADPSKSIYSWNRALPESKSAFASGDLALYVGYASEQDDLAQLNPNLNFGVAAIPQIRSAERQVDVAKVYGIAKTRTTRNPLGAATVASRLASADASDALATNLGMASARRNVLSGKTGDGLLVSRQAIISRAWADPDSDGTRTVFRAMIENVTSGALRLNEAILRADQELAELF